MEFAKGMVVRSIAGHDSGSWLVVMSLENGFAFVADGKERKVEKPKKKNIKHLSRTRKTINVEGITNKKLRSELRNLVAAANIAEESE